MKKSVAIILVMVFSAALVFPVQALAAYDKELTEAISTAKSLFDISEGFDNFIYSINKQNDKTIFNLSWNDRKNKLGNVNVTIDTTGQVISYSSFKPYDYRNQKKLPALSSSDARKIADSFARKINPVFWKNLKYWPASNIQYIGDRNYQFRYVRVENGIPFPENNVYLSVNGNTGQVENYQANWYDGLVFPASSGAISLADAQQKFREKLGLQLLFQLSFADQTTKPYLVYKSVYDNSFIDALTGEVVRSGNYYGFYAESSKMMRAKGDGGYSPEANRALTPQELEAVKSAAGMIEQSKAEQIARRTFNLDSSFKLNWVSLYADWQNRDEYLWSMDFQQKSENDANLKYYNVGVSINAADGSIKSYYKSTPYDPDAAVKYNGDQSLKIAEDFLKSLQPEKFREVERTLWNQRPIEPMMNGGQPRESNFNFTRKVSGAYFKDNGFNITVDNVSGTVTNYNFNWYNKSLPETAEVISFEQAYKIMADSIGMQMQYISESPGYEGKYIAPEGQRTKPTIKLVYGIKPEKPLNIDAFTGSLLDNDGRPFIEDRVTDYTDIKGSYAERQIKVLTEYGVALPGSELKPDQRMNQREFLYLLQKAFSPYMDIQLTGDSKEDDALYNSLVQAGIVKEGEKAPESLISRQEAVKFIIRALSFEKVAKIDKGIYKLPFRDAGKIKPGLAGYIAIAYGLNIIQGDRGNCNPDGNLKRADAFIMLYNYLNI